MLGLIYIAIAAAAPAAAAETQDSRYDSSKIICRTTTTTGSRLSRARTCMTRKQWDEVAEESQKVHWGAINKAVVRDSCRGGC